MAGPVLETGLPRLAGEALLQDKASLIQSRSTWAEQQALPESDGGVNPGLSLAAPAALLFQPFTSIQTKSDSLGPAGPVLV